MLTIENNNIYLTRGDSAYIDLDLKDIEGTTYIPSSGDSIVFTVKKRVKDEEPIFSTVFEEKDGNLLLHLLPEHTNKLEFGRYIYDVQVRTEENDVFTVITPAFFYVTGEINNG